MEEPEIIARTEVAPRGSPGLRAAIAGTGFIGRVHARSARLAGAELVGVSASSPERAAAAANELGAARGFASSEELVSSPDVDVVHVCTPNSLHVALAEAALRAGKHVICEKPIATNAADAARLRDALAASGAVLAVPFVYRYYPMVREARARVAAGDLGDVRLLSGAYLQDWLTAADDDNWRVDSDLGGASRAFADIGCHWCDLVEFVSGHRIARLSARTLTAHARRPRRPHASSFGATARDGELREVTTEDIATVMFETDRGAAGSVVVSQVSPGFKNGLSFVVHGADATLAFDQEHPDTLRLGHRTASVVLQRDAGDLSPAAERYATLPAGHPQGYHDCFDAFVADAYEAIRGEAPDGLPMIDDGVRGVTITDAVLESARTGSWVNLPA
ncbi:MAG: Gfo/Idh/MocA family protein [Thermoleophilaceae bacterium]